MSAYALSSSGKPPATGAETGSAATRRTPDLPASSASVSSGTELPSAQTAPIPVTATRLAIAARLACSESVDACCEICEAVQLLQLLGRHGDVEMTFDGEEQIDGRERVDAGLPKRGGRHHRLERQVEGLGGKPLHRHQRLRIHSIS